MNEIILDHIESIKLNISNPPLKNLHAINYIPNGLYQLASKIKIEEGGKIPKDPNVKTFEIFCRMNPIIPCTFHWFSTSLVNYVRLVGLIKILSINSWNITDVKNNKKEIKEKCTSYVNTVIPEIKKWRNKVSAHFSPTDPYDDNYGTLEQSVMNSVSFFQNRFRVNVAKLTTHGETSELPSWSVTEIYEHLVPRYWPESKIDFDTNKCIRPIWHDFVPKT